MVASSSQGGDSLQFRPFEKAFLKKKKFFFILAVLCLHCSAQGLHCSVGAFSSCSVRASRGAQAAELLGFSSCGAGLAVLGHVGS